ncbi:hypothetical protein L208DRAFT_1334293, partial [Tricholoma matsutake]
PKLYQDFSAALPIPEYTRWDGFYNLAAHFPVNSGVQPDLGPKVYMVLASKQIDGYLGSTKLHCDLCNAINLMVHCVPVTGGALWHIFKVSDVPKIREYLRSAFNHPQDDDPIHSQQYYLEPTKLAQLKTMYGVMPYTIHQSIGEAIFIPAGCPHQVRNEANCIKVVTNFLLIEALSACKVLAGEISAA